MTYPRTPRLSLGPAPPLSRQAPRLEGLRLIGRTLDRAHGMVRALLDAHRDEITVTDTDLAAWCAVHAVNGMIDGAVLSAPERLKDPRFADTIVAHVLGAVGGQTEGREIRRAATGRHRRITPG